MRPGPLARSGRAERCKLSEQRHLQQPPPARAPRLSGFGDPAPASSPCACCPRCQIPPALPGRWRGRRWAQGGGAAGCERLHPRHAAGLTGPPQGCRVCHRAPAPHSRSAGEAACASSPPPRPAPSLEAMRVCVDTKKKRRTGRREGSFGTNPEPGTLRKESLELRAGRTGAWWGHVCSRPGERGAEEPPARDPERFGCQPGLRVQL